MKIRCLAANSAFLMAVFLGCGENFLPENINAPQQSAQNEDSLTWPQKYPNFVLDSNPADNLYQLRVLSQKHGECTMHQERNLLFAMAMFDENGNNFAEEYQRLTDNNLFEDMALNTICNINSEASFELRTPQRNETGTRRNPGIKQFIDDNPGFSRYLPVKSDTYVKEIIKYQKNINENRFKNLESLASSNASKIEIDHKLPDHFAFDAAELFPQADIKKFYHQISAPYDFLIPISLNLNSIGSIWHATSMIIRKKAGRLEFIFMDPLNWKMTSTETYRKTLGTIIRFVKNPNYFKESIIRAGYFWLLYIDDPSRVGSRGKNFSYSLLRYYEFLEDLSLLDDSFFTKYYRTPTCELLENALAGSPIAVSYIKDNKIQDYADVKAELTNRFSCRP